MAWGPDSEASGAGLLAPECPSFLSSPRPPSVRFLDEAAHSVLLGARKHRDSWLTALGSLLLSLELCSAPCSACLEQAGGLSGSWDRLQG